MIGERLGERYQLVEELGRGGMGVVYRALDPQLGREVAIKMVVAQRTDPVTEERFRREAQLVAQLDHPAIVPVFDFGRHGDALFFVMPVLHGQTLDRLLAEGPLAPEMAVDIVCQVAEALDYSAEKGVIHRDIKPENIMVQTSTAGGRPRVSVMDFGLAIGLRGSRLTKTGQLPGTLVYLSPEYILTQDADGRSDLYSLGTILYECLAGEPPFVSSHRGALLFRIVHEAPAALQGMGVDGELSRLAALCLAKEPEQRPQRSGELAVALRSWMQRRGRPTLALGEASAKASGPASSGLEETSQDLDLDHEVADQEPFWGREDEYRLLRRRLPASSASSGQWVLLGGDMGIGKSRLLGRLTELAERRGLWVLRGRYARRRRDLPWHALGELLQDALSYWRQTSDAPPPIADLVSELRRQLPMLEELAALQASSPLEDPEGASEGRSSSVFDLVTQTLRRLAGERPLLIVLEDVQWAPAAEDGLASWIQSWLPLPALIVTTYGPPSSAPEIVAEAGPLEWMGRAFEAGGWAEEHDGCLHGQLGPLPRAAHGRLVTQLLDSSSQAVLPAASSLLDELYALSEGNPWLTTVLVPSLGDAGCFEREGNRWQWRADRLAGWTVPPSLDAWLEDRRRGLDGSLRRAACALAVLGERFPRRHSAWVLPDVEPDVIPPRLIELGVCTWADLPTGDDGSDGEWLRFSSPLLRLHLYGELPRRRRRSLHRRVAQGLEDLSSGSAGGAYGDLARHFSGADKALEAVTYGLLWARQMNAAGRPETVLEPSRIALRSLADRDLEDLGEVQGELRLLLAEALQQLGRSDAALAELQTAVNVLVACGERHGAARAARLASRITWLRRRPQETRRWLRRGLELAQDAEAGELLQDLWTLQAAVSSLEGDDALAESAWRQAEGIRGDADQIAPEGPTEGAPVPDLTLAWPHDGRLDDPFWAGATGCGELAANVFETLIRVGPGGRPEAGLAERFQLEDGGRRLRLRLRRGASWHDGRPVESDDVRRHVETLLRRPRPVPGLLQLQGASAFHQGRADGIEGLRVLSPQELMLLTTSPAPRLALTLSHPHTALSRPAAEDHPPLGTGPFRLVQWQGAAPWVLEAWQLGHPPTSVGRLVVRHGEPAHAVAEGLQRGEVEWVVRPRLGTLGWLRGLQPLRESLEPTYAVWALQVDPGLGPLSKPFRRQRVLEVVRRWVSRLDPLGLCASPAHSLLPAGLAGHRRSGAEKTTQVVSTAEQDGASREPLRLWVPRWLARAAKDELEVLMEEAAQFGVPMYVVYPDDGADAEEDIWDLRLLRCPLDVPDSDAVLSTWMELAALPGGLEGPADTSQPNWDHLEDLLAQGRQLQSTPARHDLYVEAEGWVRRYLDLIPLFEEQARHVMAPQVEHVQWRLGRPRLGRPHLGRPHLGRPRLGRPHQSRRT